MRGWTVEWKMEEVWEGRECADGPSSGKWRDLGGEGMRENGGGLGGEGMRNPKGKMEGPGRGGNAESE